MLTAGHTLEGNCKVWEQEEKAGDCPGDERNESSRASMGRWAVRLISDFKLPGRCRAVHYVLAMSDSGDALRVTCARIGLMRVGRVFACLFVREVVRERIGKKLINACCEGRLITLLDGRRAVGADDSSFSAKLVSWSMVFWRQKHGLNDNHLSYGAEWLKEVHAAVLPFIQRLQANLPLIRHLELFV
jgi:hypothetical protein